MQTSLRRACRYFYRHFKGRHWGRHEDQKDGLSAVLTLYSLLLGAIIALIAYLAQETERDARMIWPYIMASTITLILMVAIQFLRVSADRQERAFKRSTLMLNRWSIGLGVIAVFSVVVAWANDRLPFQIREAVLPVVHAQGHPFGKDKPAVKVRKGDRGIAAHVYFCSTKPDVPALPILTLDVVLGKGLAESWNIVSIWGWRGNKVSDEQNATIHQPSSHPIQKDDLSHWRVDWANLDSNCLYTLEVRLNLKPSNSVPENTKDSTAEATKDNEQQEENDGQRRKENEDLMAKIRKDPTGVVQVTMYYRN